jgi:hypothetical protein
VSLGLGEILRVPGNTESYALPAWARFFVDLGTALGARSNGDNRRVIVATATPTRAFAAPLCAAGIVRVRAEIPVATDPTTHFEYLTTLPQRTTVTYRR